MPRVYAVETHEYTHFDEKGRRFEYVFPRGQWREVPDEVASVVCGAHPQKLVILGSGEDRPSEPEYATTEVAEPPADRMARPRRKAR